MGFTEAALYRYFPGKGAILAAVLQGQAEYVFSTMVVELTPVAGITADTAASQIASHIARFEGHQGILLELLLSAAAGRDAALREAANAFMHEYSQRTSTYFEQLQELSALGKGHAPHELARMWVCQLLGGFVRCRISREPWHPMEQPGFESFLAMIRGSASHAADLAPSAP
jgi:AcrR family transcriptional regulator